MNTICLIQARLGSTRLPGKILMDLCGQPLLQHVVDRAKQIPRVDWAVVVTTPQDKPAIEAALPGVQVLAYAVDDNDVLGRYWQAAVSLSADYVVRVTGDCPLLNPSLGGVVVAECHRRYTYVTNDTTCSGYPDGWDVQAFPFSWLKRAHKEATGADREHVCTWMDRQPKKHIVRAPLGWTPPYPGKLSVDTQEDFDHVRRILEGR